MPEWLIVVCENDEGEFYANLIIVRFSSYIFLHLCPFRAFFSGEGKVKKTGPFSKKGGGDKVQNFTLLLSFILVKLLVPSKNLLIVPDLLVKNKDDQGPVSQSSPSYGPELFMLQIDTFV